MFYSDKPIIGRRNDCLNRTLFSEELAKAILSYRSIDNFTISLCGRWGCGKTSILNMVEEFINDMTKSYTEYEKPIIIKFNPWNYSDRSQLTAQFFKTILIELQSKSKESLKKVVEVLLRYSSILEYAEQIPVYGKYIKSGKNFLNIIDKEFSALNERKTDLECQKREVIKALSNQPQKIIVIIDDIDRLNNEQIRLIFQLVNSLAGFPNMIYLLSFDKEIVSRALSDEQKCNGEEYLEKIIQVPFNVPETQASVVKKIFIEKIEEILSDEIRSSDFDHEYWTVVLQNCISPLIKGLRDINRIINVYRFKYNMMRNETNSIDLLALTSLQICAPSIFEWISNNKHRIANEYYIVNNQISSEEQIENKYKLLEEFKNVYSVNPDLMLQTIQTLFPVISSKVGGYYHHGYTASDLQRKQRVACPSRFDLYFSLSLNDVAITSHLLNESLVNYNYETLKQFFITLRDDNKLHEYLQELYSHVQDIPHSRLTLFFKVLLIAQTDEENYNRNGQLEVAPAYECKRISWEILKRLGNAAAAKLLSVLVKSPDHNEFYVIVSMIYSIERSYGRIGNEPENSFRVVDEIQLENIEKYLRDRFRSLSIESNILDYREYPDVYRVWTYLDAESINKYFKDFLKINTNVPKFMLEHSGYWHSGKDSGWRFSEECFSGHITLENAYQQIMSLKNTIEFLKLTLEEKEIAISFHLWYNSNRTDNMTVSKKQADKLIPGWEKIE